MTYNNVSINLEKKMLNLNKMAKLAHLIYYDVTWKFSWEISYIVNVIPKVSHVPSIKNCIYNSDICRNYFSSFAPLPWLQKQPPDMFYNDAVLKKFAIFTEKQLCWRLQKIYFPVNIVKFLRASILKNICKWLLIWLIYYITV